MADSYPCPECGEQVPANDYVFSMRPGEPRRQHGTCRNHAEPLHLFRLPDSDNPGWQIDEGHSRTGKS